MSLDALGAKLTEQDAFYVEDRRGKQNYVSETERGRSSLWFALGGGLIGATICAALLLRK